MAIKVLELTENCFPVNFEIGDWVDLCTSEDITLKAPQANKMHIRNKSKKDLPEVRTRDVDFDFTYIPLGVCIEVPKGYESILVPRSSTFKRYGLIQTNSIGVIDQTFSSDKDEWKLPVIATRSITIPKGTRIAQFRVQLSQKATVWQKLKWIFSRPIKLQKVSTLNNKVRGGFGSTGK